MAENEHDSHQHDELHEHPAAGPPAGGPVRQDEDAGSLALTNALKSSFRFLKWAMVLLVIGYLATGIFKVDVNEVKFKLRFGEPIPRGSTAPLRSGLHLRWPWEEVVTVPTDEKKLTMATQFWANAGNSPDIKVAQKLDVRSDHYLLTGDANIVHMKLRVTYQVSNTGAAAYAFLIKDPEGTLERMVKASVVRVVASMKVMDVLKRAGLLEKIKADLNGRLKAFQQTSGVPLGVKVVAVQTIQESNVTNPTEPGWTRQAFIYAQNAQSKYNSLISEGQSKAEDIHNDAETKSAKIIADAQADAERLVSSAQADAAEMKQLLPTYMSSKKEASYLQEDFYQRALVDIMQQSPGAFIIHRQPAGASQQLRLTFSRAPYVPPQKQNGQGSQGSQGPQGPQGGSQ